MVAWRNMHENLQVMLRGEGHKASLGLLLAAEGDEGADEELVAWSLAHLRLQTIAATKNSALGPLAQCSMRSIDSGTLLFESIVHNTRLPWEPLQIIDLHAAGGLRRMGLSSGSASLRTSKRCSCGGPRRSKIRTRER